ncbi:MAG TPA: hypothetical protein VKQ54_16240 [Caulobacteraceae bacterium]|nr:hypothetical protein [Caulobacteraceae bacterium]
MDFIETLFHLAPDGGGGATELALFIVTVVAVGVVVWRRGKFTRQR